MTREELEKALNFVSDEKLRLLKENELLKEELTNLKNDITRVYNTMISLETINKQELESDVEVL